MKVLERENLCGEGRPKFTSSSKILEAGLSSECSPGDFWLDGQTLKSLFTGVDKSTLLPNNNGCRVSKSEPRARSRSPQLAKL